MIQPLILVLISLGFVPVWLASRRASRAPHKFAVHQTERDRQRTTLFLVLTHRQMAAGDPSILPRRFLPVPTRRTLSVAHHRPAPTRQSNGLSSAWSELHSTALLTVITMLLLVWSGQLGSDRSAAAGAAAGAIILLAERMHGLGGSSGSMYENTLYMRISRALSTGCPRSGGTVRPDPHRPIPHPSGRAPHLHLPEPLSAVDP